MNLTDVQLMNKYQTANEAAKREIEGEVFRRHFGIVRTIANAFRIEGIEPEDRASECISTFLKAVREFDPNNTATLKTWIKLLVKRKLVDLFRQKNQCSEVPAKVLRSLHEVANEGDEMALEDIIASDEDIHADLEQSIEVEDTISQIREDSFVGLIEAVSKANMNANKRLVSSFVIFAEYRMTEGQLTATEFADIKELVADWSKQSSLFSMAPPADSKKADSLIRGVFRKYISIQTVILYDFAQGFQITEIAERYGLPTTLVSEVLAAIREVRDGDLQEVDPDTRKVVNTARRIGVVEQAPLGEAFSLFADAA